MLVRSQKQKGYLILTTSINGLQNSKHQDALKSQVTVIAIGDVCIGSSSLLVAAQSNSTHQKIIPKISYTPEKSNFWQDVNYLHYSI